MHSDSGYLVTDGSVSRTDIIHTHTLIIFYPSSKIEIEILSSLKLATKFCLGPATLLQARDWLQCVYAYRVLECAG